MDKPGSRQFPAAKESSRKVREVRKVILSRKERKEMEGGNGVREANGITQFANGEPKRRN